MIKAKITYWDCVSRSKTEYESSIDDKNGILDNIIMENICSFLEGPAEIYWDKDFDNDSFDFEAVDTHIKEKIAAKDYNDFYCVLDTNDEHHYHRAYVGINYVEE